MQVVLDPGDLAWSDYSLGQLRAERAGHQRPRAGDRGRAGPVLPLLPRPVRAVADAPGGRLGDAPRAGRHHDLQGREQRLPVARPAAPGRARRSAGRAGRVPAPRDAVAGVRDQHAARRDDRQDDPLRLRPDGRDAPAGFTLFVPEEDVTDIDWSVNQTIQAILSGGITSPASIHYFPGAPRPAGRPDRRPPGAPDPGAEPACRVSYGLALFREFLLPSDRGTSSECRPVERTL